LDVIQIPLWQVVVAVLVVAIIIVDEVERRPRCVRHGPEKAEAPPNDREEKWTLPGMGKSIEIHHNLYVLLC
jgi:hypothetical protein